MGHTTKWGGVRVKRLCATPWWMLWGGGCLAIHEAKMIALVRSRPKNSLHFHKHSGTMGGGGSQPGRLLPTDRLAHLIAAASRRR